MEIYPYLSTVDEVLGGDMTRNESKKSELKIK